MAGAAFELGLQLTENNGNNGTVAGEPPAIATIWPSRYSRLMPVSASASREAAKREVLSLVSAGRPME